MLRLIKHFEYSGSTNSIDVTNIFSADYKTYCLQIPKATYSSGNTALKFRFINSSGSVVSSGYNFARYLQRSDTGFTESRSTTATEVNMQEMDNNGSAGEHWFFQPFENRITCYISQSSSRYGTNILGWQGTAMLNNTTSCTGLRFFTASNNITGLVFDLYGLRV